MEKPLFWHQGLFLQPQHFQIQDRYVQSLLAPLHQFIQPYLWGVGELDMPGIMTGNMLKKPHHGEFMFPDGTFVTFPGNALIEARPFNEEWVREDKPFTVFLGLKKYNDAGENVTVVSDLDNLATVTTRFVTTTDFEESADLHQNGPKAQIKRLYYVLKLFGESEMDKLGDYSLIPLAQLVRMGGEIHFSENFIPPSLSISSSDALLKIVGEIRDQIAARCVQLEESKQERGIQTAEFGTRDMVYLLALRSLNRFVPQLFHLTESRPVHPWTVYAIIRSLIGELSTFSTSVNVHGESSDGGPRLPAYNHETLWECFSTAHALVIQLLNDITAGPDYIIPLISDGTYFTAELDQKILNRRNRFYLVFESDENPDFIRESVQAMIKLGTRESLPELIVRAVSGVKLEHLPLPPQSLPRRERYIYFQVDQHTDHWMKVEQGYNIALYWDSPPEDLRIQLMVVGSG